MHGKVDLREVDFLFHILTMNNTANQVKFPVNAFYVGDLSISPEREINYILYLSTLVMP